MTRPAQHAAISPDSGRQRAGLDRNLGESPSTRRRGRAGGVLRHAWGAVARRSLIHVTVTAPPQDAVLEPDVAVPMRDGTTLRANVYRPADDRPHPAIVCLHPYGKDRTPRQRRFGGGFRPPFQYHLMQTEPLTFSAWTTWEAPDPAYWVSRGYAVVNADLRGFGTSGGRAELFGEHEGTDGHDLVEWVAAQPWCSGRVGMSGVSYLAISQWATAATRPPHLSAICPWEGFTDLYRDFARPGGIRENGFLWIWNIGFRIAGHPVDVAGQIRSRPYDDAWYAARNHPLEDIDVPALICASFSDHNLHSRGSFDAYRRIRSPHTWLYTHRGQKWATYYSPEALTVQARFFDHFLHGNDTGLDDLPSVRVEVREDRNTISTVRTTTSWPPLDTQWHDLHLSTGTGTGSADGSLAPAAPIGGDGWTFDIARGRLRFWYRFDADTELIGPMLLRLELEVHGTDDVALFAGIRKFRDGREVAFNGSYGFPGDLVTHGMLLASHRAVDSARSRPHAAFHPHDTRQPLTPGERVELQIELLPSATLFRAGEDLRLDLQGRWFFSRNPLVGQFPPAYAVPNRDGTCTVRSGTLSVPMAEKP